MQCTANVHPLIHLQCSINNLSGGCQKAGITYKRKIKVHADGLVQQLWGLVEEKLQLVQDHLNEESSGDLTVAAFYLLFFEHNYIVPLTHSQAPLHRKSYKAYMTSEHPHPFTARV
jgi:hypothetical protein